MKKVAALMLGVALTSSYASAGVVVFMPGSAEIDIAAPGPVSFDVVLQGAGARGFDAVDMIIGSDLVIGGWSFSADALAAFSSTAFFDDGGVFPNDIFLNATNQGEVASGILFGTVTLNAPTGPLALGDTFDVFVESGTDGFSGLSLAGSGDPLNGSATITVVPEPATLTLLGLAAVGLIRRRRAA